jgi:hypothetical protein
MGFFVTLLYQIAIQVAADLLLPKPEIEDAKPAELGDFNFPTATEGRVVPQIWGTVKVQSPNVVWYGDFVQDAIVEKQKTGMFSSQKVVVGYRYYVGLQQALALGEVDELRRIWIGDKLVIDETGGGGSPITHGDTFEINEPDLYGGEDLGQGGIVGTFKFFAGTSTQNASGYLSNTGVQSVTVSAGGTGYAVNDILTENGDGTASTRATFRVTQVTTGIVLAVQRIQGGEYSVQSSSPAAMSGGGGSGCTLSLTYGSGFQLINGVAPAYRGICYIVPDVGPTLVGTAPNLKPWKFELRRIPNGLALAGGDEIVDGGANPANVIYEVLTSTTSGYGVAAAKIDTANFTAVASTLASEGNGFSFVLDKAIAVGELLQQLEDQIDGIVQRDPVSGKYTIKLIRDDYSIGSAFQLNETNVIQVRDFNQGTWEGTVNLLRTPFADAGDNYKLTSGVANDMANFQVVGRTTVTEKRFAGVKTASLANALAWRELRPMARPTIQATLVVTRAAYGLQPGDPVAWTDAQRGLSQLPLRVKSVDLGNIETNEITLTVSEDVFVELNGSFGDPVASLWTPPSATLVDYPADEKVVIEAPRALTLRDPNSTSPTTDKVFAAARRQGPEVTFQMWQRNDPVTPAGAYAEFGEVFQFQLIGQLASSLPLSATNPVSSAQVVPVPNTQAELLAEFVAVLDVVELGTELVQLILVDDEFMLVTSAQSNASNVQLNTIYRGVLDSVQADHAAGANVYLLFTGAGLSSDALPAGNVVDVKLLPRVAGSTLAIGDATAIQIQLDNRTRRPYPVASFDLNSVELDQTNVDLDASGSGEDVGVLVDSVIRRDFRTVDEIEALGTDAGTLFADFPTENSTTLQVHVKDGSNELFVATAISGTSYTIRQLDILEALDTTTLPSSLTFGVRQEHTFESTSYTSRVWLDVTSTIVSDLIGQHAFGALDESDVSTVYVVGGGGAGAIDHVFTLSSAFSVGDVEYRVNGGSWVTLISATTTSGTIPNAAISDSDDIEVRHLSTDVGPQKLLTMTVSGTVEAYGVLIS